MLGQISNGVLSDHRDPHWVKSEGMHSLSFVEDWRLIRRCRAL